VAARPADRGQILRPRSVVSGRLINVDLSPAGRESAGPRRVMVDRACDPVERLLATAVPTGGVITRTVTRRLTKSRPRAAQI